MNTGEDRKKAHAVEYILERDAKFKNEDDLILQIKTIYKLKEFSTLAHYWRIGNNILEYYRGEYGDNELKKIAKGVGIGIGNLSKTCEFAHRYSKEQVRALLNGPGFFCVSWHMIAQNLTIEPDKLIEALQRYTDKKEFYNAVKKLKNPNENRGQKKTEETEEQKGGSNDQGGKDNESNQIGTSQIDGTMPTVGDRDCLEEMNKIGCDRSKIIDSSQPEIDRLKDELEIERRCIEEVRTELGKLKNLIEKHMDNPIDRKPFLQAIDQIEKIMVQKTKIAVGVN